MEKTDLAALQLCKARAKHCNLVQVFDRTEEDLKASMEATVAATCAVNCGSDDRADCMEGHTSNRL